MITPLEADAVRVGRWISVMMAAVAALLVAGILLFLQPPQSYDRGSILSALGAAVMVGSVLGVLHWLALGLLESELGRLTAHVEALGRPASTPASEATTPPFSARHGLAPLARALQQSLDQLRSRIKEVQDRRRELELQFRISDAQRQHLEAILNSICDAVVVTDAFNEVALANEAAARLLRFDLSHAVRQPVDHVVRDPVLVKMMRDTRENKQYARVGSGARKQIEHAMPLDPAGATTGVFEVTFTGIHSQRAGSAAHESSGVVTILRDITREKAIADSKSDFVSAVSHELRTPLSSIKAYLEMLVDGEARDERTQREFYSIIQAETDRLQRLIDNILNISRIESGVVKAMREPMSLAALIRDAVEVMQPQARAKNITLRDIATPLYYQVRADRDMIHQAVVNLIGNAIKYTPSGGKVTVSLDVDEHSREVRVSVTDTGVGIAPEHLPHLFEKFYRVSEHKKLAKGTGLGLNLVKQIIETVHGGKIGVESTVGMGSTFTFSLPMAEDQ